MAGNTGQYCSQYRQALHTVITCSPWESSLSESMPRGLLASDPAENRPYRHADPGDIALAQNVPRHDLPGGANVLREPAVLHDHARTLVRLESQVGEGYAGAEGIPQKRRRVEPLGPVTLLRREAL